MSKHRGDARLEVFTESGKSFFMPDKEVKNISAEHKFVPTRGFG